MDQQPNQQQPYQQQPYQQQPYQQQPYQQQPYQPNGQYGYNQGQFQQPMYPVAPPPTFPGKGLCIAALVLGIVSIVLAWFYMVNIVALATGITGVACAAMGRKKALAVGVRSGIGTAGLVCSIIGLALAAIGFFACTVCICVAANTAGVSALF